MISPNPLDNSVALKQRWPLEPRADRLKEQVAVSRNASTTQILNPTRWLTAVGEYCKGNRAAMALLVNFQLDPNQHEWKFVRFLGKGAFGAAALYQQQDDQQQLHDAVAIKAAMRAQRVEGEPDNGGWPLITMEAAVMTQLNDCVDFKGVDEFVYLRKYTNAPQMPTPWPLMHDAYYLEYCPYGDLQQLKMHHQAWQKHVPEVFLWHLFQSFARASQTMAYGRFQWLGHNATELDKKTYDYLDKVPGAFILHGDVKPANILLTPPVADKDRPAGYPEFPSVRLGDFGCARVLHAENDNSRRWNLRRGTREYQAPELRTNNFDRLWNQKWYRRAGKGVSKLLGNKHITPSADLWAFAAIIWELMTLRDITELSDAVDSQVRLAPFGKSVRGSPVHKAQLMLPLGSNAPRYSAELQTLIAECLELDPAERLSSSYVLRETLRNTLEKYDILCRDIKAGYDRHSEMELVNIQGVYHYPPRTFGNAQLELDETFWQKYAASVALWRDEELPLDIPPGGEEHLTAIFASEPTLEEAWKVRTAGENALADERSLMWATSEYNSWFGRHFKRDLSEEYLQTARAARARLEREWDEDETCESSQPGRKRKIGAFAPTTAPARKRSQKASSNESLTKGNEADLHAPYRSAVQTYRKPSTSAAATALVNEYAYATQPRHRPSAYQAYRPRATGKAAAVATAAAAADSQASLSPRSPRSPGQGQGARQRRRSRLQIARKPVPNRAGQQQQQQQNINLAMVARKPVPTRAGQLPNDR